MSDNHVDLLDLYVDLSDLNVDLSVVVCLFVCLGFSSHSRIFHSYGDVTFAGEGLQTLTYARHSWPLSSEGSLLKNVFLCKKMPYR